MLGALSHRVHVTSSPAITRLLPALCFAQYTKIMQRKRKSPEPEPADPSLSAEQLERIARNKRTALARLSSARTPPGFGEAWRDELAAEFGKTYFKQVRDVAPRNAKLFSPAESPVCLPQLMQFVADERRSRVVYPPADEVFSWTQMCDIRDVSLPDLEKSGKTLSMPDRMKISSEGNLKMSARVRKVPKRTNRFSWGFLRNTVLFRPY